MYSSFQLSYSFSLIIYYRISLSKNSLSSSILHLSLLTILRIISFSSLSCKLLIFPFTKVFLQSFFLFLYLRTIPLSLHVPPWSPNWQRKFERPRHFLCYTQYYTDSCAGKEHDKKTTCKCWSCLSDLKNKRIFDWVHRLSNRPCFESWL